MPNFVSITWPILQILVKTQIGLFLISGILVNPLKIVIFPEPVMLLTWELDQILSWQDKQNNVKKLVDNVMWEIVTLLLFFGFLDNLEQSRDRIPDKVSTKVLFSVTVTFCLTKTENRAKKSQTQL